MTKIAIRLMTAVTSPINVAAVVAGKCLMTPDALATVLFSKAIGAAPSTPTSAQCAALGATPSYSSAVQFQTEGVQLVRNDARQTFALLYSRLSVGNRHSRNYTQAAVLGPEGNNLYLNKQGSDSLDIDLGISTDRTTATGPSSYPINAQDTISLSNGESSVITYSKKTESTSQKWGRIVSRVAYTNTNGGNGLIIKNIATSSSPKNQWQTTKFTATPPVSTAIGIQPYVFSASGCEYYEIDIDAQLIANITTLATDLFIVVPLVFGKVFLTLTDTDFAAALNGQTSSDIVSLGAFVFPLSSLTNAGSPIIRNVDLAATNLADIALDKDGSKYDIRYAASAQVSLSSFSDFALLPPPTAAAPVGPHV